MNILGLWDGHDASAALLVDGRLVAAVNEERLTRRKLEIVFPTRSIDACLQLAGLQPSAIDAVASCTTDVAKAVGRVFPSTKEAYYQSGEHRWVVSPQMVADSPAGLFADLLRHMRARIGVGAVLNTSFNVHGEPLVCSPEDAVAVFAESGADALAIGPFLVCRSDHQ